jgi:hypothetical protein
LPGQHGRNRQAQAVALGDAEARRQTAAVIFDLDDEPPVGRSK